MGGNRTIWIFAAIGGSIGSYIPLIWGGSSFSFSSILLGSIGAIVGIWLAFRLTH